MLSYKEYKQLNESLYGAINLGIKSPNVVSAPIGATGASDVVETEEATEETSLEEAKKTEKCKCGKMMKKGMDCDCDKSEDEKEEDEKKDEKEEEGEENSGEDEESEEEKEDEDSEMMMKKKMKKKAKKEWSEILADVNSLLEGKDDSVVAQVNNNLENIKKLLETKEMTEDEKAWWASVNQQLGSVPGSLGFAPVGKITQAIR